MKRMLKGLQSLVMGGDTDKSEQYQQSIVLFSNEEQRQITQVYGKICGKHECGFSEIDLYSYAGPPLSEILSSRLFNYFKSLVPMTPGSQLNDFLVKEEEFVVGLAHMLKGTPEDRARVVSFLATDPLTAKDALNADGVNIKDLTKFICDLQDSYRLCMDKYDNYGTWKLPATSQFNESFSQFVLQDLNKIGGGSADPDYMYTLDQMEDWLTRASLLIDLMTEVVRTCFPVNFISTADLAQMNAPSMFPMCEPTNWNKLVTMLELPTILFLNHCLPPHLRRIWRPLFSSISHGESFATMMKSIMDKGPSLIIIEDTEGHVFGGFNSHSWQLTSQFGGDANCFLFSIKPQMGLFESTGYNNNFIYLNQGQMTLPNGLGMGGQFEYFGLWLDYQYGEGESCAEPNCSTFGSPQLSKSRKFRIARMEAWGVGPEPLPDNEEGAKGSILDHDLEAKAMLTMLGKGPRSEGLRDRDPTAESPEDHEQIN